MQPPQHDDVGADEDVLDTGTPRRLDRRLVIALGAIAVVVVGVLIALKSSSSPHRSAAPTKSATHTPSSSAPPIAPVPDPRGQPSFTPLSGNPDTCPAAFVCAPARTTEVAQAAVRQALIAAFGKVGSVRTVTRIRYPRGHPGSSSLFTRRVDATTPFGPVTLLVHKSLTGQDAEYLPISGRGTIAVDDGFVAGYEISVALRIAHRHASSGASVDRRISGLASDARLVELG